MDCLSCFLKILFTFLYATKYMLGQGVLGSVANSHTDILKN